MGCQPKSAIACEAPPRAGQRPGRAAFLLAAGLTACSAPAPAPPPAMTEPVDRSRLMRCLTVQPIFIQQPRFVRCLYLAYLRNT